MDIRELQICDWAYVGRAYDIKIYCEEPDLNEFELAVKNAMLEWSNPTDWAIDDDFVRKQAEKLYSIALKDVIGTREQEK